MKNLLSKLKSQKWSVLMLNALALMMVFQNVNVTCAWIEHQPEVPEEAKRFKKF